jgi:SAM-dependent methyltransferase
VTFEVAGEKYDRYMGRYSRALAPRFVAFAGIREGRVLDVGCGPGALTGALAEVVGAARVAAVDPSQAFVAACRARVPGADVRQAPGEALPFDDATFDAALSQLVLSFVRDADRFVAEQRRVVRAGGVIAACMWEQGRLGVVEAFWAAARAVDPAAPDESGMPFRRVEELDALWRRAGLTDVAHGAIEVSSRYDGFDDYWAPFEHGIGPAGAYLVAQPPARRDELREATRTRLGDPRGPFELGARAIAVRGLRPS